MFMRLWVSKNSEVPPREQLVTQLMLAITSQELKPGEKLPSTRELARRFKIHANTASAAYRELASRGWVENRRGSGVYVKTLTSDALASKTLELDQIIATFLTFARRQGFSIAEIKRRVGEWLVAQAPDHFLLIEPDPELRAIIEFEVTQAIGFPIRTVGFEVLGHDDLFVGAATISLYSWAADLDGKLPSDVSCMWLRTRPVAATLPIEQLKLSEKLVTVVSRWPDFLRWARAVFLAAGGDPLSLNFVDAREDGWQSRLAGSDLLVTEGLTAQTLKNLKNVQVFQVLADDSLVELKEYVERFLEPGDLPAPPAAPVEGCCGP
jgi:GntR family transcriptional regulator